MPITELVAVARGMEYASQPGLAQLVSPLYSVQRKVRILLSKGGGWMLSRLNTTSESASKAIILIPDSFFPPDYKLEDRSTSILFIIKSLTPTIACSRGLIKV